MKKILIFSLLIFQLPVCAINIGTYKADTEYGLIDGFKFNFFNRDENKKRIELKSETEEEKKRIEREKELEAIKSKEDKDLEEYELFRFMQQNTVVY